MKTSEIALSFSRFRGPLSRFKPGNEISIEVVGLRPGERLDESLVMDGEELLPTEHEKVFMVENHRLDAV